MSDAERARRYRARKTAEKYGVAIPDNVAAKRPATYRPPKNNTPHERKVAAYQARLAAAERASARAEAMRARRSEVIERLPQARNPEAKIFESRPMGRKTARDADAAAIRRNASAQKIQALGRGLKRAFTTGANGYFASVEHKLEPEELARLNALTHRLNKLSPQALAIYFHHEGEMGSLGSVYTGLNYPVTGERSDALDRYEALVQGAESAEGLYGPKAVGLLNV